MSRLKKEYIWEYYFNDKLKALCPCCRSVFLDRNHPKSWEVGHIIHHKDLGPDIYENLRPVCKFCNDKDVAYENSYVYMVSIFTMLEEDVEPAINFILRKFDEYKNNPSLLKCIETTNKSEPCQYRKIPRSELCGRHIDKKKKEVLRQKKKYHQGLILIWYKLRAKIDEGVANNTLDQDSMSDIMEFVSKGNILFENVPKSL